MANPCLFGSVLSPSHLPTFLLMIGYGVFWLELYWIQRPGGHTSAVASGLFLSLAVFVLWCHRLNFWTGIKEFKRFFQKESWRDQTLIVVGGLFGALILILGFRASMLPPHLPQEFDALNYHITLPRQHLLLGSFSHISWSLADLYLLPVDFALAPYWLVTDLPNKFPQFLFFPALMLILGSWARSVSESLKSAVYVIFGVLGTQVVAIQIGTAMLDGVLCYLFIAALDSLRRKQFVLAGVEGAFYLWSKSFIPVQAGLMVVGIGLSFAVLRRWGGFECCWLKPNDFSPEDLRRRWPVLVGSLMISSFLIGGPFVVKSVYYAGTPLFPLAAGILNPVENYDENPAHWESITTNANQAIETRDAYGSGRGMSDFLVHLWMIAVPEKGVNNRYDYPVGLVYLLCLGPFGVMLVQSIFQKRFSVVLFLVLFYWMIWWLGSHQSRFLTVALILMVLTVMSSNFSRSQILGGWLCVALALATISIFRAHKGSFSRQGLEILREKDRSLLVTAKSYSGQGCVELRDYDVAYADFPVCVKGNNSVFVLSP